MNCGGAIGGGGTLPDDGDTLPPSPAGMRRSPVPWAKRQALPTLQNPCAKKVHIFV
eukprot:CAMPEP_0115741772 /NCGR_PEP_ID=MMETSP0272-20121206/90179_1 /TAXON_ID=71861 /ORGANISM="Scrippsiella trochoidea, Strain CCMP3099" /LENGTH=55 /DNA_ID=CAMNT_0003186463 /DNA_START=22 /DNA_END=185 /DNA_ORIENTATION=-